MPLLSGRRDICYEVFRSVLIFVFTVVYRHRCMNQYFNKPRFISVCAKSHAARVITATWVVSFLLMLPYPIGSTLVPFMRSNNSTGNMCRLVWPSDVMQTW